MAGSHPSETSRLALGNGRNGAESAANAAFKAARVNRRVGWNSTVPNLDTC